MVENSLGHSSEKSNWESNAMNLFPLYHFQPIWVLLDISLLTSDSFSLSIYLPLCLPLSVPVCLSLNIYLPHFIQYLFFLSLQLSVSTSICLSHPLVLLVILLGIFTSFHLLVIHLIQFKVPFMYLSPYILNFIIVCMSPYLSPCLPMDLTPRVS